MSINQFSPKKRLITRVFVTSVIIISLVGFALASLVNTQHAHNRYNEQTAKLIAQIPSVAAELQENNILPRGENWLEDNQTQEQYLIVSCSEQFQQIWTSALALNRGLIDTCERFDKVRYQAPPYFLELSDTNKYLLYLLPIEINDYTYRLLVMQDAEKLEDEYYSYAKITYIKMMTILICTIILLLSAAYWGMRPLTDMSHQLDDIAAGKIDKLSENYPEELKGVTLALNQLLQQGQEKQDRYQNSLNDLAHSLKTRIAAVHALIADKQLSRDGLNQLVLEQVGQMDTLVQYQLKRAVLGPQGLIQEQTPVKEVADELSTMMLKIYQHKGVNFQMAITDGLVFPGSRGDLMELMGNVMENAFRLCISTVRLSAKIDGDRFIMSVDDDGMGVEESQKARILKRGERADTQSPGQGIGLAVCKDIVDSYHGELTIHRSDLQGAQFSIALPVNKNLQS